VPDARKPRTPDLPTPQEDLTTTLELVPLADVRPHPRNDGTHPPEALAHLKQSLTAHGVYRNVVVAEDGTILAGHGVVEAARALGHTAIAAQRMPYGPDDPRALQLLVGDNHLARLRQQDDTALAALLRDLVADDPAALLGTGYDEESLAALLESQGVSDSGMEDLAGRDTAPQIDRADELREQWGTAVGQVWGLGNHRILCGDSTDTAVVARLMQGQQALLCHADPPYGMGKATEGIANDNLYAAKLDAFQMRWWQACRAFLAANASVYLWGNAEDLWRLWYQGGLQASARLTFRNELVWDKGDAGAGVVSLQGSGGLRMYPPGSERCLFFMLGEQGFNTNAENYWEGWEPIRHYLKAERDKLGWDNATCKTIAGHSPISGCHWFDASQWTMPTQEVYEAWQRAARGDGFKRDYDGFKRDYDVLKRDYYATRAYFDNTHDLMTDVWPCARVKGEDRHDHPTPKPLALIERMVKSSTPAGALVYEPFLGSGTTLVAAENLGRVCVGCEIDPGYVAVTLQRFFELTSTTPVRLEG
jgi:DNA modification methylase